MMNTDSPSLAWRQLPDLPDAEGFAGSYAGTHQGALLVAGGANFPEKPLWEGGPKRWTNRIFVLPAPGADWLEPAILPKPLGYGATASLPQGVLCIGGSNAEGSVSDVLLLKWNGSGAEIETWPSLPVTLTGHAAAVLDGKVYVMGGSLNPGEQDAEARMWVLDSASPSSGWQEAPAIPGRGRFLHQTASCNGRIYILGGIGLKQGDGKMVRDMLTEAWSYNPQEGWKNLAPLPYTVAAAPTPAPVFAGRIHLLGGDDATVTGYTPQNHPGFHNQSLVYDPATDTWQPGGSIGAARAVLPCVEWHGMAAIVNGEQKPGKRSNQIWAASL
ncbi:hypothetical protein ICN84_09810 [Akkermansia glycaniphila]|uniref:hypothetical protein n=1 Tax=Akkermansia glycaniphila TaxID=1679444 RepID=UPI001C016F0F|nr:hypothetical protein [Akkermansia glycaniphila]MBT9450362.1 hypothetical protein [Akkermansia glycaniphila]